MSETELEKKVTDYIEAAKENKNVDVAALMMNALQTEDNSLVSGRSKHWAYLLSLAIPPAGLLFAAWYYLSDKSDGKKVALICVILTAITGLLTYGALKYLFATSPVSSGQLEQIHPTDVIQLTR